MIRAGMGLAALGCALLLGAGAGWAADTVVAPDGAAALSAEHATREGAAPFVPVPTDAQAGSSPPAVSEVPAWRPVTGDVLLTGLAGAPLPAPGKGPLPVELASFLDQLRELERLAPGLGGDGQVQAICGRAAALHDTARDIARAPLLEMTQMNFDSWRHASAALLQAADRLGKACADRDGPAAVQGYLALRDAFRALLRVRR